VVPNAPAAALRTGDDLLRQKQAPVLGAEGAILMKAAVVHTFGEPLHIEDLPIPEPGPGQIVVKVDTSGLCHTDIHAAHGDWPVKPSLPPKAFEQAFGSLRRNGRLVFVGLPAENKISLPIFETVLNGITVTGSIVGTRGTHSIFPATASEERQIYIRTTRIRSRA
jgi:D-arabinose 1-dehydrogenase-like Zn-dependent alcohol dehydrogenase